MTANEEPQQASLQRDEARERVLQAVGRLPKRHRRLLLLRELEGLSYALIAEEMGITSNTVGKLLHQARQRFRLAYFGKVQDAESKEKCRLLGHLLSAFYDDELLGLERQRVAQHLAECPDCRRMQDELASTSELLSILAPTPAPPGVAHTILARTPAGGISLTAGGGGIWKLPLMLLAGGGFIAAVLAVVLLLWQDSESPGPLVVPPTATPTPSATSSPTPVATPTPTATPSPTPSPTASPTPTPSPTRTPAPSPTPVPTPSPTATPIPSPTPSPAPSPTVVPTPSPWSPAECDNAREELERLRVDCYTLGECRPYNEMARAIRENCP